MHHLAVKKAIRLKAGFARKTFLAARPHHVNASSKTRLNSRYADINVKKRQDRVVFLRIPYQVARSPSSKMFSKFSKSLLQSNVKVLRCVMSAKFSAEASPSATKGDVALASASKPFIHNVSKGDEKKFLNIAWDDGTSSRFPYIFLRDNCRCPKCFHNASKQYILHAVADLDLDIEVQEASVSEDGRHLECLWPNGHESVYTLDWLRDTRMREGNELKLRNTDSLFKDELILWDRVKLQDNLPSHDYDALINDEKSMFDFLYSLYQHGMVLVNHAPARDGVLREMAAKIGWNRRTHLGEHWDIKIEDDPTHLGSTENFLHFHSDLTYYSTTPTIQALHCILQSQGGGRSMFVDGFNVVKQLKKISPEAFRILTAFDVGYCDEGNDAFGEYSLGYSAPVIKLNKFGRVENFQYNHFVMSGSTSEYTPREVFEFYDAFYQLTKLVYKPENVVDLQLQPGQIALFQNTRVMHGRSAFEGTSVSLSRWLQGMFFEHDVIFSKLRVLQRKLGLKTPRIYKQSNDFF